MIKQVLVTATSPRCNPARIPSKILTTSGLALFWLILMGGAVWAQDLPAVTSSERDGYALIVHSAQLFAALDDSGRLLHADELELIVLATAINVSGSPVIIEADSLTLRLKGGPTQLATAPTERGDPALVGTSLNAGEGIYGYVSFNMGPESREAVLRWCPNGKCNKAVYAELPSMEALGPIRSKELAQVWKRQWREFRQAQH